MALNCARQESGRNHVLSGWTAAGRPGLLLPHNRHEWRFRIVANLCLLTTKIVCDDAVMSEHTEPGAGGLRPGQPAGHQRRREDLTTQQMRTVGQRRADAEEKLARHLREANHPAGGHPPKAE